jgi:undecaprenyl-diphosphatase
VIGARARERFFSHAERALWLGVALLAFVAVAAVLVPAGPLSIDSSWSEVMHDIASPALKQLALLFNWLGRGIGRAVSIAAVGIVLLIARRWLALAAFVLVESVTPLLSSLLKALVDRPRPPGALIHPSGSSFPSGHAAYAGAMCVALVVLFTSPGPRRVLWWSLAALGVGLMAWSRTYLQVHWLSDVVAGSLLGVGVALVVFGSAAALRRA